MISQCYVFTKITTKINTRHVKYSKTAAAADKHIHYDEQIHYLLYAERAHSLGFQYLCEIMAVGTRK